MPKPYPKQNEVWINTKHRDKYLVLAVGSDATNERAGIDVIVYGKVGEITIVRDNPAMPARLVGPVYVREVQEFLGKFAKEGTVLQ